MNPEYQLQKARPQDRQAIINLLTNVGLPTGDLPESLDSFMVAGKAGQLVGSVGLERFGDYALLRSLAVDPVQQGTGLGKALYQAAMQLAAETGIREVYLITTTAAPFFAQKGFTYVDRSLVPATIRSTAQFSGLCPSSATVMNRSV